jgi:hypothetical protein
MFKSEPTPELTFAQLAPFALNEYSRSARPNRRGFSLQIPASTSWPSRAAGNRILHDALTRMTKASPRLKTSSSASPRSITRRRHATKARSTYAAPSREAVRARRKFLMHFPGGFRDETYLDWEGGYKWDAHNKWNASLNRSALVGLLKAREFKEIAARAIRVESRTNLLFSFEKMALRGAVRSPTGAKIFALALFNLLHSPDSMDVRFSNWIDAIAQLPRRQTRVQTWPLVTVFGFIAQPDTHFFLKPTVTREAARRIALTFNTPRGLAGRSTRACWISSRAFVPISATCDREI